MSDVTGSDSRHPIVPLPPEVADELAAELLGDLRTRLGGLHVAHARRVADSVRSTRDDHAVPLALLHDVVEKGRISLPELRTRSGDERLVALVDLLTKRDHESEEEYLTRLVPDPVALAVKRADLADKQYHHDASVDPHTATGLWQEAQAKLAMLERLVEAHERSRQPRTD